MYFRLNNFTGRLIGSTHIQPYFPIGVNPLEKSDPPKIVYHDASLKPVRQTSPRYSSTSTSNMYAALKKKQALFQKIDDLPVHFKGGSVDKVLFGVTMAFCVIGIAYSLQTLYVMSFPKKA
jgi:cytochrome c oxidase subunit 7a